MISPPPPPHQSVLIDYGDWTCLVLRRLSLDENLLASLLSPPHGPLRFATSHSRSPLREKRGPPRPRPGRRQVDEHSSSRDALS